VHKILTLRTAANLSFKNKQMRHCASFCRRCIELGGFFSKNGIVHLEISMFRPKTGDRGSDAENAGGCGTREQQRFRGLKGLLRESY